MNEKKQINKKSLLGVVAVVLLVAVMGILYSVFREKPVEGSKSITIEVVGSRPEFGSSQKRYFGLSTIARAIAARLIIPPDSSDG